MPSVTEYFGAAVTNFGPLTTTFTAAPSCATANNAVYYANASDIQQYWGRPTCTWAPFGDDCYPSGGQLDGLISEAYATPTQGFAHYYSPGIACPSGWTTAGTVAHVTPTPTASSDGVDAFNRSGVFTEDPWASYREWEAVGAMLPQGQLYIDVLDAAETLVYCCPSGFIADVQGSCYSSLTPLTSYSFSENCLLYYPDDLFVTVSSHTEPSWTVALVSVTDMGDEIITSSEALSTAWWTSVQDELALATQVPAVALVYQASDLPNSGAASSSGASILLNLLLPLWILIGVMTGAGMIIRS